MRTGGDRLLVPSGAPRIGGDRGDGPPDEARGLRRGEAGRGGRGGPIRFRGVERLEHQLRAHPARGEGDRGRSVRRQLVAQREGESVDGDLGEVVEDRDPVVLGVVVVGPVGELDEQAAAPSDEQWRQRVRRDQVGVDGEAQQPEPIGQVALPDRPVPVGRATLQPLAAPDVVDEDVEAAVVAVDPVAQPAHLIGVEVVDGDRDAGATRRVDELGGLLDRLGPPDVVGRQRASTARPTGADDRRTRLTERDRDAAAGPAGGAGHDRHPPGEGSFAPARCCRLGRHHLHTSRSGRRRASSQPAIWSLCVSISRIW